jgi:uncharacterized membrane protein YjdF
MARQDSTQTPLLLCGIAALVALGVYHALRSSTFVFDVAISLIGLLLFARYGERFGQDRASLVAFLAWVVLHNLGLYDKAVLLLPWDKWMHLIGGAVLALMVQRALERERWGAAKQVFVVVAVVLGMGALHEIVEWLGYGYLGAGDGFLFYGQGDFGEWQDSVTDMMCNLAGAVCVALLTCRSPTGKRRQ